jgi:hypothetical protein
MSRRKLPYGPGDWIAVPLKGGWAVGLIARMHPLGQCLGYFFRPLLSELPGIGQLQHLRPEQAIYVRKFMSADLTDGKWPVLGRLSDWSQNQWPVPKFRYRDRVTGHWVIRVFDEELNFVSERSGVSDEEVTHLPDDVWPYGGALQLDLAELLGTTAPVDPSAALLAAANDPPRHFLYFHDRELAEHAAEACRKLGYEPVFGESVDEHKPWLVLVQHKTISVTDEQMERAAERIAGVAAEWGGEYDGWDRPVSAS